MNDYQIFLEAFRRDLLTAIKRENIIQTALEAKYGVSQALISNFLAGKRGLSLQSFLKLWPFVYGAPFPKMDAVEQAS